MALERQLRVLHSDTGRDIVLKAAFATGDLKVVDQHFGSAERFAIYAVTSEGATLLEVAEFGSKAADGGTSIAGCPPGRGTNENKLLEKFVVLDGCAAVYCVQAGGSAVRQLTAMGIQPLRVPEGIPITVLLHQLQNEWRAGASGWLARALGRQEKDAGRFDAMEAEGWNE